MKRGQNTLDSFLKKRKPEDEPILTSEHGEVSQEKCPVDNVSQSGNISEASCSMVSSGRYDIGNYVDSVSTIDDKSKCELLEKPWQPPPGFQLPYSTHIKKGKQEKRYLNQSHLDSFPWLVYSNVKKGLFCRYCVLFTTAAMAGSRKQVPLKKLVREPLTVFAKLLGKDGDLLTHERKEYHRNAVEAAKHFLKAYHSPEENVMNKINAERLRQVKENTQRLKPIVETVILLGRQNIPFRGHRDDGKLNAEAETAPLSNEGNFRELLRYRVSGGDIVLQKHLENSAANATYISKTTQNQLITCCGEEIREAILNRVKEAIYYCVIFDETTDLAHNSQLSLCLAYVHKEKRYEDFIEFVNIHDECFKNATASQEPAVTGKVLGKLVLQKLKEWGLDLHYCIGIATDGCSMMISEQIGAVAEIKKEAKYAVRCPCFSHALNLSISKCSSVKSIRNSLGVIKEVVGFFNASSKRVFQLLNIMDSCLKGMCETRWVERSESLLQFTSKIEKVIEALQCVSEWNETAASTKAKLLLSAVRKVQFIVALHCQLSAFRLFLPLSQFFQKKSLDLSAASSLVDDLLSVLKKQRHDCEDEFSDIFADVLELCSKLEVNVKVPRTGKKQMHRSNVPHSTPEEYYRRTVYIPMLDAIIRDLETRFSNEALKSCELTCLLPRNLVNLNDSSLAFKVKDIWEYYGDILILSVCKFASEQQLVAEVKIWREKWLKPNGISDMPQSVEEVINTCDKDIYKLVYGLIQIFFTMPVSVASAERSFSSLRRLKTYLRNQMTEDRLTALALLHIHREIEVDVNKVIQRYAKIGKRKLDILL